LQKSLPAGVEVVTVYDRSALISRAVDNLTTKLLEEFAVVAVVCLLSSLALGTGRHHLVAAWRAGGIPCHALSGRERQHHVTGGIAIAVGAMVDAAVVMIENAHKHLEHWHVKHPQQELEAQERWRLIGESAAEVGPALFVSLLIITLSFIPVFTLEAQEGRLFSPLAFTKTYSMAAAAGLSVTLIPVLMGYDSWQDPFQANPLNRLLIRAYHPLLNKVLRYPKTTVALAGVLLVATAWPIMRTGGEFMPPLDEGDLLYMPPLCQGLRPARRRSCCNRPTG
jgi:Cu(I)/Ag(I) efflux system membrane protein CusA/SilA